MKQRFSEAPRTDRTTAVRRARSQPQLLAARASRASLLSLADADRPFPVATQAGAMVQPRPQLEVVRPIPARLRLLKNG